jgi:hypothetical protein
VHPCDEGDFVDCRFPFAEQPTVPGPVRHIVYVRTLARFGRRELRALVMLTTTSPTMIARIPEGCSVRITQPASRAMGMRNEFVVDIHRLALLPIDRVWFPDQGGVRFVVARGDARLRAAATRRYDAMLARRREAMIVLGPNLK